VAIMYYFVYILQSIHSPDKYYTGYTTKLKERLVKHNNGEVSHTSKYKPWKVKTAIAFTAKDKALTFEKYLKSHSGRAFAKKHF
jgi:putative endonuclease